MLFIQGEEKEEERALLSWSAGFKGSLVFKAAIDRYLEDLERVFVPRDDFKLGDYTILTASEIKDIFVKEYGFFPFYRRVKGLGMALPLPVIKCG